MAFTFSVKVWKKERPSEAKGSGVAEAIEAVVKAWAKKPDAMNEKEAEEAKAALEGLTKAFGVAQGKIKADKKTADIKSQINKWLLECSAGQKDLATRAYQIKVQKLQVAYTAGYDSTRDRFVKSHDAARLAKAAFDRDPNQLPENKDLQNWMGGIRDMSKMCSKEGISAMSIPEAKLVKVTDVTLPGDVAAMKAKAAELMTWCEVWAKALKRGARTLDAGLDDSKAIEKELKAILADYEVVTGKNKPLIAAASALATNTAALADEIKREIVAKNTDAGLFKRISADLKRHIKDHTTLDTVVRDTHYTYREGTGDLAKRQKVFRAMPGYDASTHGKIIEQAQGNVQVGVRRVTIPLGEAGRQIDRARRHLQESTSHRGYV